MENLNDVEFGSDKSTEEAPILVAQRYLNIYRQIHIFNKEKRDQFDDELLALPQNITDFFKRMPGGRLLVEHIEEVKTERGISFVKSNKDDFTTEGQSNASTTATPTQVAAGGTVVIDASFAQTLAQSMANAFKQLPAQNVSRNGLVSPSSADFSKAFDLIAEEIKVSRASLLDVLQEMHTVTSSLIASQVSIARTLESFLSKSDVETIGAQKNIVSDRKIPQQEEETLQDKEVFSKSENETPILPSQPLAPTAKPAQPQISQPTHLERLINQPLAPQAPSTPVSSDEVNRKKKKKKKNKENRSPENVNSISSNQIIEPKPRHQDIHNQPAIRHSEPSLAVKSEELVPVFEGIIHSTTAKHLDADNSQFDNNTFESPLSSDALSQTLVEEESTQPIHDEADLTIMNESADPQIGLDDLADLMNDNNLNQQPINSAQGEKPEISPFNSTENIFDNDGLDFALSEQDTAYHTEEHDAQSLSNSLDNVFNSDGLDFALPEQNTAHDTEDLDTQPLSNGLDNVFNSDGLDYTLPEQNTAQIDEPETSFSQPQTTNLDDIFNGDGLDFTLPESNTQTEDDINIQQTNTDSLDSMFGGDGLDFALPEQNSANKTDEPSPQVSSDNLDSIFNSNDLSTTSMEQTPAQADESASTEFSADSLDNLFDTTNTETEFSLPKQTLSPADEETTSLSSLDNLDDIFADNSLDTALPEQHSDAPQAIGLDEDLTSLDSLATQISEATPSAQTSPDVEDVPAVPQQEPHQSRYSAELDRIRAALTSDNIDISSIDQPIALDDYNDDESVLSKEEDSLNSIQSYTPNQNDTQHSESPQPDEADSEDWDWEYVDENGNPVSTSDDDEDWEWEYVEDDGTENEPDNNSK